MSALDTTRTTAAPAFGRIVTDLFGMVAAWNDARITRKSLSQLSARELDDIGLSYGDIDSVATRTIR